MSTQLPAGRSTHRLARMIAVLVLAAVVAAGVIVLVLHYRSRDPGTAARLPADSNSRQVNPAIERRAQQFLAALRAGDEERLRAMVLTAFDRDNVNAFGRRDNQLATLQTSDLGGTRGELDIAVPCKNQPTQHAIVLFGWKRTSFISSDWFAIINQPGTADVLPAGCPAP